MRNTLIIITILLISPNLSKAKDLTTWAELTKGLIYYNRGNNLPFSYDKLDVIVLNGETMQKQENCQNCPFQLTWIENSNIFYNKFELKVKKEEVRYKNTLHSSSIDLTFSCSSWLYSTLPSRTIHIEIVSDCDTISEIIATEITNSINNTLNKVTKEEVDLTVLFSKLKDKQLEKWISNLPTIDYKANDCREVYELLSYVKDGDKEGFGFSKYELSIGLKTYLDNTISNITLYLSKFGKGVTEIDVKCIGYTDTKKFDKMSFIEYKEFNVEKVYYNSSKCGVNTANDIVFVPLISTNTPLGFVQLSDKITNNCQLSALRAFKSIKYLKEHLMQKYPNIKINYSYGAGGEGAGRTDELKRKVNIKLSINAAKQNK